MKKLVIIIVLVGILFALNSINPSFSDHKSAISTEINLDSPIWENLEYKDYFVISFTSNSSKSSMVSLGFCKYIKVIDNEWIDQQNK